MSKESEKESTSESSEHQEKRKSTSFDQPSTVSATQVTPPQQFTSLQRLSDEREAHHVDERKAVAKRHHPSDTEAESTDVEAIRPRQVIAVSASKGPAAFFNLARKFLVTDEMCDLSALEGAIVSAVDAAHLLERSKLANIVRCVSEVYHLHFNPATAHRPLSILPDRIQTSYVTVEPKRRKQGLVTQVAPPASPASLTHQVPSSSGSPPEAQTRRTSSGRELRRARIVITVRRTESYKNWLEENPLQAIIAGDVEDDSAAEPSIEAGP